jgi:hypothetical protein
MTQESLTFASSPFWPIAIGFFGLGTGYFILGRAGSFWLSPIQPRSRSHDGHVGFLDAWFLPIPHRRYSRASPTRGLRDLTLFTGRLQPTERISRWFIPMGLPSRTAKQDCSRSIFQSRPTSPMRNSIFI